MRLLRLGIRVWIALTSTASFMAAWVMLAQAPKPAQNVTPQNVSVPVPTPMPTLSPLPNLDFGNGGSAPQTFGNVPLVSPQVNTIVQMPMPAFRTGGS
jgi:hypothetical protein